MWSKDERQLKQVDIWTSWRSSRKIGECNPSDRVCIGNSMICRDIWHKYREWYFEIVRQFWNISGGIYTKYHVQIMLLFVYTTTRKSFVIITCKHFKLSWNTTALSQSNCRNFSRSSMRCIIPVLFLKWLHCAFLSVSHYSYLVWSIT